MNVGTVANHTHSAVIGRSSLHGSANFDARSLRTVIHVTEQYEVLKTLGLAQLSSETCTGDPHAQRRYINKL